MAETPETPAPMLLAHEQPLPPRLDLYVAAAFLTLGMAIIGVSLSMPTFYERLQQIYTAPAVVPALHGAIIALLSIWLGVRSLKRGAIEQKIGNVVVVREGYSNMRLAAAALMCLVYAGGLIGRMPFWLATILFVTAFILLFEWRRGLEPRELAKRALIALAVGAGTGVAVVLVFERLFLVRLP